MLTDTEGPGSSRRIQSLVQICQRVAGNHIESISSLGELPFNLVKPILERCSAEQLLRVEDASPHLRRDSADLWKTLCFRTFPLIVVRHNDKTAAAPGFWRDYFFVLREAEAKRLEEVGSRIRSQRREADERKREREVKLTDRVRLPPPKRQRTGWNIPTQPKSLFQKTRSDASKLQKNMYNARMIPPKGKEYSHSARISGSTTLPPSQPSYSNRVTVKTVIRRPPTGSMETSASVSAVPKDAPTSTKPATSPTSDTSPVLSTNNDVQHSPKQHSPKHVPSDMQSLLPPAEKSAKPQTMTKKDRMASLFVPKHRAHSQLAR